MSKKKLVSIIIPARNEAKNIAKVIKACRNLRAKFPVEIIVVDGASRDRTVEIAKKSRADRVVENPYRRGKGVDFWEGGLLANGDYIVTIDADGQFDPSEIDRFVKAFEAGADVVIANRFSGVGLAKDAMNQQRILGNKLFAYLISWLIGYQVSDVLAGFKGAKKDAFKFLDLQERGFGYEVEMVIKAWRMNMRIDQVPVSHYRRGGDNSKVNLIKDGLMILIVILKLYFDKMPKYRPS